MSSAIPERAMLDSGILIRYLRGWAKAAEFISLLSATQTLCVSAATVAEILVGCRTDSEFQATEQVLAAFDVLPIDGEVARLAAQLIRQHPGLFGKQVARGFADALIAATAWRHQTALYTLNARQFSRLTLPTVHLHILDQDAPSWM